MNAAAKQPRTMPKGGRKGGSVFPRLALKDALAYAKKLVVKTHTNNISQDMVFSGVVGAKSGTGKVRISALRQYGLLIGDQKAQFAASDLAKNIAAAPSEELAPLYRQCALKPTIFKGLSDTFRGDTISRAKLKQRAAELKVHPEETESCVDVYVSTMLLAELVTVNGEQVTHLILDAAKSQAKEAADEDAEVTESDLDDTDDQQDVDDHIDTAAIDASEKPGVKPRNRQPSAAITVNVTLDSTTDSDKLAKQLALLRKYGAI